MQGLDLRSAKHKMNVEKGTFLGCVPHTTRNFLWCDCGADRVKIATHGRFNKGHSDLPLNELPPNVHFMLKSEDNNRDALKETAQLTHWHPTFPLNGSI